MHGVGADADVDADREHGAARLNGHRQHLAESARDVLGMFLLETDAEENVAADAVDVFTEGPFQAFGNLAQDGVPGLDVEEVVVVAEGADVDAEQAEPPLLVVGNEHVHVAQVLDAVAHGVHRIIIGELLHMAAVLVEGHGELHDVQIGRIVEGDVRLSFDQQPALFGQRTERRFALEPFIELAEEVPEQFLRRLPALRVDEVVVLRLKEDFRPVQVDFPEQLQRKPLRQIGHLLGGHSFTHRNNETAVSHDPREIVVLDVFREKPRHPPQERHRLRVVHCSRYALAIADHKEEHPERFCAGAYPAVKPVDEARPVVQPCYRIDLRSRAQLFAQQENPHERVPDPEQQPSQQRASAEPYRIVERGYPAVHGLDAQRPLVRQIKGFPDGM